jgi:hypothetical protein
VEPINHALPAGSGGGGEDEVKEQERVEAQQALSHGARGAILVAGVAVALLFIGWLLFYFVLFMRRGYVG